LLTGITYEDLESREAKAHRAITSDYGGMYIDELCLQYCTQGQMLSK